MVHPKNVVRAIGTDSGKTTKLYKVKNCKLQNNYI